MNIWKVEIQGQPSDPDPGTVQPDINIDAVIAAIHIGKDLSHEETTIVRDLIKEYADCFALLLSEVYHVPGAVYKIDVPKDKVFKTKVHQRPLTPPQRTYLNSTLDRMLEAGITVPIVADKVKCASPTTLGQEVHQGGG